MSESRADYSVYSCITIRTTPWGNNPGARMLLLEGGEPSKSCALASDERPHGVKLDDPVDDDRAEHARQGVAIFADIGIAATG